eukprot:11000-Amphidinium_carterae.1
MRQWVVRQESRKRIVGEVMGMLRKWKSHSEAGLMHASLLQVLEWYRIFPDCFQDNLLKLSESRMARAVNVVQNRELSSVLHNRFFQCPAEPTLDHCIYKCSCQQGFLICCGCVMASLACLGQLPCACSTKWRVQYAAVLVKRHCHE